MHNHTLEYHKLRPEELVERRNSLPAAYLGLGILEWHGQHNPLGLDGYKANGIALRLAEQLGGVVMPPLFWGDNRAEIAELVFDPQVSPWLPEGTKDQTGSIMEKMELNKSAFQADATRSEAEGGWRLWEALLVHIMFQIETLGFQHIVLIPGHYPLITPLQRAIEAYQEKGGAARTFVLTDMLYAEDGSSGDHAAAFETSLMMALAPDRVNLDALDPDPAVLPIGVLGEDPRKAASKEFGEAILAKMTELTREFLSE